MRSPLGANEFAEGIRDMHNPNVLRRIDIAECCCEKLRILRKRSYSFDDQRPAVIDSLRKERGNLVLFRRAGHFDLPYKRKKSLRGQQRRQPFRQILLGRGVEAVAVGVVDRDPTVVEQGSDFARADIEQSGRVPRHSPLYPADAVRSFAVWADAITALSQSERQTVGARQRMMMARSAGDVSVSREQRIVKQQPAQFRLRLVERIEIIF